MDRQRDQNDEEQRHEQLGRAFNALLHAQLDDEVRGQHEERRVEERPPRIADEVFVDAAVLLGGGVAGEVARQRVDHVLGRPARDHEVEAQDQEGRDDAVVAQEAPAAVERLIGPHGIAVRGAAHGELRDHERQPQQHDAEDVDYKEGAAAVVAGDVGEAPDVAQPHGAARGDQHGAHLAAQCGACVRVVMHNGSVLM